MPDTVKLFNKVAEHYDALNTFFSLGMDRLWRKRLSDQIRGAVKVLDIATGTGEVAIETVRNLKGCRSWRGRRLPAGLPGRSPRPAIQAGLLARWSSTHRRMGLRRGNYNSSYGRPLKSLEVNRILRLGAGSHYDYVPKIFLPLYLFYFRTYPHSSLFGTEPV
jgi:hypothetical protein